MGTTRPPKRRLQINPHGATSQKTEFFIVTAVKASNATKNYEVPDYVVVSIS
jgi:hypothetical protein